MLYIEKVLSKEQIIDLLITHTESDEDLDNLLSQYKLKKFIDYKSNFHELSEKYKIFPSNFRSSSSDYFNKLLKINYICGSMKLSSFFVNFVINKYKDLQSVKNKLKFIKKIIDKQNNL